jgi:transmembrane sensor
MSVRESSAEIDRLATEWVARADRKSLTVQESHALEAWLDGDVRRRGAYVRAQAAWALLDRGGALAGAERSQRIDGILERRRVLFAGCGAVAASIAAVAGFSVWSAAQRRLDTRVGEVRRVALPDGSSAVINTASAVDLRLEPRRRGVKLLRGEAWFDVAKDPSRPFVVEAGDVRVRAVGTAFSVRRMKSAAEVVVTEGVVEVWHVTDDTVRPRLRAGESAMVEQQPGLAAMRPLSPRALSPREVEQKLAWRDGMIAIEGQTLEWAAEDFNRYNRRQIIIEDPQLAAARFDGVFRVNDPDGFARAAASILNAHATITDSEIVLSRRAPREDATRS